MKIETLALLLGNAVLETAPTNTAKGYRRVSNEMTFAVPEHGLLVVGHSPYDDEEGNYGLNYWAPRCHLQRAGGLRSQTVRAQRTDPHDQLPDPPDAGPGLHDRQLHASNGVTAGGTAGIRDQGKPQGELQGYGATFPHLPLTLCP